MKQHAKAFTREGYRRLSPPETLCGAPPRNIVDDDRVTCKRCLNSLMRIGEIQRTTCSEHPDEPCTCWRFPEGFIR